MTTDEILIGYKGKLIDVSKWASFHPGGTKVLKIFNNKDATSQILSMHTDSAIQRIEKMAKISKREIQNDQFLNNKYQELLEKFKKEGRFKIQYTHEILKIVLIFSLLYIALGVFAPQKYFISFGIFFGLAQYFAGWISHDWSHRSAILLPNNGTLSSIITNSFSFLLSSILRFNGCLWWKLRHNTHHVCTNHIEYDPDVQTSPILTFFEDFNVSEINYFQHVYYIPLMFLLQYYWMVESLQIAVKYSIRKSSNIFTKIMAICDVIGLSSHVGIFFFYLPVYYYNGLFNANSLKFITTIVISHSISGFFIGIIVFANHYGEDRHGSTDDENILINTAKSTTNITGIFSNNKIDQYLLFILSGGLNMQIEHHLFPMLPRNQLRGISKDVQSILNELNLSYREDTLLHNLLRHLNLLKMNVEKNISETPFFDAISIKSDWCAFRLLCRITMVAISGVLCVLINPNSGGVSNSFLRVSLNILGMCLYGGAVQWLNIIKNECEIHRFFRHRTIDTIFSKLLQFPNVLLATWVSLTVLHYDGVLNFPLFHLIAFWAFPIFILYRFSNNNSRQQQQSNHSPFHVHPLYYIFPPLTHFQQNLSSEDIQSVPIYRLNHIVNVANEFSQVDSDFKKELCQYILYNHTTLPGWYRFCQSWTSALCLTNMSDEPLSFKYFIKLLWNILSSLYTLILQILAWPYQYAMNELVFWKSSRDIFALLVICAYLMSLCVGYSYFVWTPFGILYPLFGPKSRLSKFIASLQADIAAVYGDSCIDDIHIMYKLNIPMCIYLMAAHVLGLIGLFYLPFVQFKTFLFGVFLYSFTGIGLSMGAHKLWSHRSFKASFPVRLVLLIAQSMSNQGSIYHWVRDHRTHHHYFNTEADPHDGRRGWFFRHCGWLMMRKHHKVTVGGAKIDMSDVYSDPLVRFQLVADPWFNLICCFGPASFIPLLWGEHFVYAFFVVGCLRYVLSLHAAWLLNSIRPVGKNKPHRRDIDACNNSILFRLYCGEFDQNFHYAYERDYRASAPPRKFALVDKLIDICIYCKLIDGPDVSGDVLCKKVC